MKKFLSQIIYISILSYVLKDFMYWMLHFMTIDLTVSQAFMFIVLAFTEEVIKYSAWFLLSDKDTNKNSVIRVGYAFGFLEGIIKTITYRSPIKTIISIYIQGAIHTLLSWVSIKSLDNKILSLLLGTIVHASYNIIFINILVNSNTLTKIATVFINIIFIQFIFMDEKK